MKTFLPVNVSNVKIWSATEWDWFIIWLVNVLSKVKFPRVWLGKFPVRSNWSLIGKSTPTETRISLLLYKDCCSRGTSSTDVIIFCIESYSLLSVKGCIEQLEKLQSVDRDKVDVVSSMFFSLKLLSFSIPFKLSCSDRVLDFLLSINFPESLQRLKWTSLFSHCFLNWNEMWSLAVHFLHICPGSPSFCQT